MERATREGHPFPLVIVDGQMPEMDGFTLVKHIQERRELGTPTIVMLTSIGQKGDASRCLQLGISAYLTKPARQSELLQTLCRVVRNRPRWNPLPWLRVTPCGKIEAGCKSSWRKTISSIRPWPYASPEKGLCSYGGWRWTSGAGRPRKTIIRPRVDGCADARTRRFPGDCRDP